MGRTWIVRAMVVVGVLVSSARGDDLSDALARLSGPKVLEHIKVLASDAFEGRGPGTPGEAKTVAYLAGQFQGMGLKPGNPDGSYVQDVPLVGFEALKTSGSIQFKDRTIDLKTLDDWVAVSRKYAAAMDALTGANQPKPGQPEKQAVADFRMASAPLTNTLQVDDSDVVFVGYGVVAPEYGWDDYKGVDVKGKTVIMLINDPAVPDTADPSKLDPSLFQGKAMTYYGRWTYKYEIASEKGAAACLIVHEAGPAGYPYQVVTGSWSRENFDLFLPDGNAGRVTVEAWLALDKAKASLPGRRAGLRQAQSRRDPQGLQAGAAGRQGGILGPEQAPAGRLQERGRPTRRVRPGLEGRAGRLHRALGPPRPRSQPQGGSDLQRGGRQRLGDGLVAGDRPGVHPSQDPAEAVDPVPELGHRRGEGIARGQVLRLEAALSPGEDAGRHQHGRDQPLGPDEGHRQRRPGEHDPRRRLARGREGARADRSAATPSRRRGRSTGRTTSSSPRSGCPRSTPRPGSTTSASRAATARASATSTPRRTTTRSPTR